MPGPAAQPGLDELAYFAPIAPGPNAYSARRTINFPAPPVPAGEQPARLCCVTGPDLPGCRQAQAPQQSSWAACALSQHVPDMLPCLQLMVARHLRHTTLPRRLHPTAQLLQPTQAAWPGPLLPMQRHQSLALLACTHLPTPLWVPTAPLRARCLCTVSFRLHRCGQPGCTEGCRAGCCRMVPEQLGLKCVLLLCRRAPSQVQGRPSVAGVNAAAWPTAPHSPGSTNTPFSPVPASAAWLRLDFKRSPSNVPVPLITAAQVARLMRCPLVCDRSLLSSLLNLLPSCRSQSSGLSAARLAVPHYADCACGPCACPTCPAGVPAPSVVMPAAVPATAPEVSQLAAIAKAYASAPGPSTYFR